ncbi:MAG: hypothetical protein V3W28_06665 [Thermoplasmata archaeon]
MGISVKDSDIARVQIWSTITGTVRATLNIKRDDGGPPQNVLANVTDADGDRTVTSNNTRIGVNGEVTSIAVDSIDLLLGDGPGHTFVTVFLMRDDIAYANPIADYIFTGNSPSFPGKKIAPTQDRGFLDWTQEANDAAGSATTTVSLAAAGARRVVRAVIVKWHSSSDAATRTITITLRDLADSGGPTGWSIASDTWVSPTLTLTVNEEGLIHVGEHGFVSTNDAGTLAYADNSSAPNPFPLEVEAGDPVDLIIAAGSGHANDDYDVWVQYEEWLTLP